MEKGMREGNECVQRRWKWEYIIDNLVEFKYDIIDFMEQNYFLEDLIKEDGGDGIFTSLGVDKKKYKDTITEILIRYEVIV